MRPVYFENESLVLIDQTLLPTEEVLRYYTDYREVGKAIKTMIVRGAPAIGVTAGYGMFLAAVEYRSLSLEGFKQKMHEAGDFLIGQRPTAVNLAWAVKRMLKIVEDPSNVDPSALVHILKLEADAICEEDIAMCHAMGAHGEKLFHQGDTILTHCNAGALATADYGTALGVIRAAHEAGKNIHVFADETRPLLQGARLTAYELQKDGVPVTLITDNMAGWMMHQGKIDGVIVGADRIASNGDTANKIGTYSVSVLAKAHGIPFYVAAPTSTIDFSINDGNEIIIEDRDPDEIAVIKGQRIALEGVCHVNPSFDVTPHQNITAIVTEEGVVYPPFDLNIPKLRKK